MRKYWKRDSSMSWSFLFLLFTTYGGTVLYILQKNLKFIIIKHWEFFLIYIAVFGLIGLWATRMMRQYEESKHFLRVTVRWIIRALALILVYNSSASPLISLTMILVLSICYIIRAFFKFVGSSKKEKRQ